MSTEDRQKTFLKGLEELSKQTGITMTVQNQPEQLNNGVVQIRASIALVQVEGWVESTPDNTIPTHDVHWADGAARDNTSR